MKFNLMNYEIVTPTREILEKGIKNNIRLMNWSIVILILLFGVYGFVRQDIILLDIIFVSIFVFGFYLAQKIDKVRLDIWKGLNGEE